MPHYQIHEGDPDGPVIMFATAGTRERAEQGASGLGDHTYFVMTIELPAIEERE